MSALLWFVGPIGKWFSGAAIIVVLAFGIYEKGRFDERAYYKAKIERQKNDAIAKGDKGRARALRDLELERVPTHWFRD